MNLRVLKDYTELCFIIYILISVHISVYMLRINRAYYQNHTTNLVELYSIFVAKQKYVF